MRGLVLGGVLALLGFASHAGAQDLPAAPFERFVSLHIPIRVPVHECSAPVAVIALSKIAGIPAGAEYLPVDCQAIYRSRGSSGEMLDLYGLTVGEALRK